MDNVHFLVPAGHQLGRSSSQHDFSNFSQPAFHSVTTTTASGATAASSSTPGATSSLPTSSSQTQTSVASSGSASSLSDSDKDLGAGLGSSVHARPCPPPHSTLSVLQPSLPPSTSSLPPSSSSGSKTNQLPQTTGHYLTEGRCVCACVCKQTPVLYCQDSSICCIRVVLYICVYFVSL